MSRRPIALTVAAAAVFAGSVAFASSSGAAVDQDLVVSTAAGPPGTAIEVSSASCVDDEATSTYRFLSARLIAGSGATERLAGAASDFGGSVTLVVPDWVDPDEPATIEASCFELVVTRDEIAETEIDFDAVDFDIEPGAGSPVQERTPSRTSLKAGQAFQDTYRGCTLPGATYIATETYAGSDLSGRELGEYVAGAEGELTDGSVDVVLSNGTYGVTFTQAADGPVNIGGVSVSPTDIAAGTYSSYGYCGDDEGTVLFYEPTTFEVTGDAPFGSVDLTQPDPHSRAVVLGGRSCTAGTVDAAVIETSLAEIRAELAGTDDAGLQGQDPTLRSSDDRAALAARRAGVESDEHGGIVRSNAVLGGGPVVGAERAALSTGALTPDAEGAWSGQRTVEFDDGLAEGYAVCGDPLGDGYYYDPQVLVVAVTPAPAPPTTTIPPAVRPTPANAVNGTPSYTG